MNPVILKYVLVGLSAMVVATKAYLAGGLEALLTAAPDILSGFAAGALLVQRGEDISLAKHNAMMAELRGDKPEGE